MRKIKYRFKKLTFSKERDLLNELLVAINIMCNELEFLNEKIGIHEVQMHKLRDVIWYRNQIRLRENIEIILEDILDVVNHQKMLRTMNETLTEREKKLKTDSKTYKSLSRTISIFYLIFLAKLRTYFIHVPKSITNYE